MNYTEMCRYIVAREGFDWEEFMKANKNRETEYRQPRQICYYLGLKFFGSLSHNDRAKVFGHQPSNAIRAIKVIENDRRGNKALDEKIIQYEKAINEKLKCEKLADISDDILRDIAPLMERMQVIAEAYCRITGKRIV
jgi:hypothetical protein